MILTFVTIVAGLAAMPPGDCLPDLSATASRLGTTRLKLETALTLPERPARFRPREQRHCVQVIDHRTDSKRQICRSLADWHDLGFELDVEARR